MKEKIPHCPQCKTANFVVLDKTGTQLGTAIGGTAGAGVGYATLVKSASVGFKAILPTLGISVGNLPAALLAILSGFLAGAATGSAVGEQIDSKLRIQYRCNACGALFKG